VSVQTDPLGGILACYRSTASHITDDAITAAWAFYDRIRRPVIERLVQHAEVHRCVDCDLPTSYAIGSYWLADDALWAEVVGEDELVLCPACFHDRAQAKRIAVMWRAERDDT
jgi:hypothetical protein